MIKEKSILVYGDSNTWGYIPGSNGQRFEKHQRWPGILQKELGKDYQIVEEGLCGRTTVMDDYAEGEGRNGYALLAPILESHLPINILIIMLGTNDLKNRFGKSSLDIALSIASLVKKAREVFFQQGTPKHEGQEPKILVIVPPPIIETGDYKTTFIGGAEKSKEFKRDFAFIAERNAFNVFQTDSSIKSSNLDGIHLPLEQHQILGKCIADYIKTLG